MLVSVIPHFNRQICESWTKVYPGRPFVTIITDLADFPPRFWIEPIKGQYVIAGTEKAADQARSMGHDDAHIFLTSGMILRPDFYLEDNSDPLELRKEMGLRSEEHTSELQSRLHLVCRLLLEKKKNWPDFLIVRCPGNPLHSAHHRTPGIQL